MRFLDSRLPYLFWFIKRKGFKISVQSPGFKISGPTRNFRTEKKVKTDLLIDHRCELPHPYPVPATSLRATRYIGREPAKVSLKPTRVEPHACTEPRHSLLRNPVNCTTLSTHLFLGPLDSAYNKECNIGS